ncbi:MAG: tyrosine-protein phosphatase [Sedimentisphaerales bacterium]|nr:tyrosine-protein phosphatase [Sedimentisphaerales bacterium]
MVLILGTLPFTYRLVNIALGDIRRVIPGQVYRSGQPSAKQLRQWIKDYQLRTIVDLRGPKAPFAAQEQAIASAMGVKVEFIRLSAFELAPRNELLKLIQVIRQAERPVLLHCYSGIDRAGLASALAAWLLAGQPYSKAKWYAWVPPGPWKHKAGQYHISDTLAMYEAYCRSKGLDPDDPSLFMHWATCIYSPKGQPTTVVSSTCQPCK